MKGGLTWYEVLQRKSKAEAWDKVMAYLASTQTPSIDEIKRLLIVPIDL